MSKKVNILLAVYKPNKQWFIELLESINNQSYENISLIICNDYPNSPIDKTFIEKYITRFSFSIVENKKNLGSNKTFEYLTTLADGDYLAYCDQDDLWDENKIKILVNSMEETNSALVFSDMKVINSNGKAITDSISNIRKRQKGLSGDNLTPILLTRNFISGCSMLIKSEIAKSAIPFPNSFIHDHWLVIYASSKGNIQFIDKPLISYRQHENNQTSVLMNVENKEDYLKQRIIYQADGLKEIKPFFIDNPIVTGYINKILLWCEAREIWWKGFNISAFYKLITLRSVLKNVTLFELILARLPESIFKLAIKLIKKGII